MHFISRNFPCIVFDMFGLIIYISDRIDKDINRTNKYWCNLVLSNYTEENMKTTNCYFGQPSNFGNKSLQCCKQHAFYYV